MPLATEEPNSSLKFNGLEIKSEFDFSNIEMLSRKSKSPNPKVPFRRTTNSNTKYNYKDPSYLKRVSGSPTKACSIPVLFNNPFFNPYNAQFLIRRIFYKNNVYYSVWNICAAMEFRGEINKLIEKLKIPYPDGILESGDKLKETFIKGNVLSALLSAISENKKTVGQNIATVPKQTFHLLGSKGKENVNGKEVSQFPSKQQKQQTAFPKKERKHPKATSSTIPELNYTEAAKTKLAKMTGFDHAKARRLVKSFEADYKIWYCFSDICTVFGLPAETKIEEDEWKDQSNIKEASEFDLPGTDIFVAGEVIPNVVKHFLQLKNTSKQISFFGPHTEEIQKERPTTNSQIKHVESQEPENLDNTPSSSRLKEFPSETGAEIFPKKNKDTISTTILPSTVWNKSYGYSYGTYLQIALQAIRSESLVIRTERDQSGHVWYCTYDLIRITGAYSQSNQSTFVRNVVDKETSVRKYHQEFHDGRPHPTIHVDSEGLTQVFKAVYDQIKKRISRLHLANRDYGSQRKSRQLYAPEQWSFRRLSQIHVGMRLGELAVINQSWPIFIWSFLRRNPILNSSWPIEGIKPETRLEKTEDVYVDTVPQVHTSPDYADAQSVQKKKEEVATMESTRKVQLVFIDPKHPDDQSKIWQVVLPQLTQPLNFLLEQASILFVSKGLFTFQDLINIFSIEEEGFLRSYLQDLEWLDNEGKPGKKGKEENFVVETTIGENSIVCFTLSGVEDLSKRLPKYNYFRGKQK